MATVDAFSFTVSFPGKDPEYVLLVYDALKGRQDSVFQAELLDSKSIRVTLRPVVEAEVADREFLDRSSAYIDALRKIVSEAESEADRRYRLLKEVQRAQRAVDLPAKVVEELLPSVW